MRLSERAALRSCDDPENANCGLGSVPAGLQNADAGLWPFAPGLLTVGNILRELKTGLRE
jgi:hypothetical protein